MIKGSIYIFVSKLFSYITRLALPMLLVRILTKTDFGVYRQFFVFESAIAVLFQFGINHSLFFFIPRDEKNGGAYLLNSIILNVVIYSTVFSVLRQFTGPVSSFLNVPVLEDYFWPLAVFTLIMMLMVAADTFLLAKLLARASAIFEISGGIVVNIITLLTAYFTRDLTAIIVSLIAGRALRLLVYLIYIHFSLHGFRAERYFMDVWPQIRYGIVLGLGAAAWTLMLQLNNFFVTRYYGTEQFAIYSAGMTQIPILQMYLLSVVSVSLGRFTRLVRDNRWDDVERLWRKILASLYGVGLPLIVGLLLVSRPLITFMFTPAYASPPSPEFSFGAVEIFRLNVLSWLHLLINAQLVIRALDRNDITLYLHLGYLAAAPFVLYGCMHFFGAPGILGGHAFLLISARGMALFLLNRLGHRALPYVPGVRAVFRFYRDLAERGMAFLNRRSAAS